jgi:hypothetical protein
MLSRRTKWHTIAYNILAMLYFARNGLLIAYHISGFVFDVIMLGEIVLAKQINDSMYLIKKTKGIEMDEGINNRYMTCT